MFGANQKGRCRRQRESTSWTIYGPLAPNFMFPERPEAAFTFPFVAIRTAKFQCVTTSSGTVTAEAAGSSPVVPAIYTTKNKDVSSIGFPFLFR